MSGEDIHARSLTKATDLTRYSLANAITPLEVACVLAEAGVSHVLIGAHGLGGWRRKPRACERIEVLVAARHYRKAVRALRTAYPQFEAEEEDTATRLRGSEEGQASIHLLKPDGRLMEAVFEHTKAVQVGDQELRIPSLEMAITLTFASMMSRPWSDADKYLDAHDFLSMAQQNHDIDWQKLSQLGDLIRPRPEKDLVATVRRVRAGEKLNL